ncbi:MAG: [FeFe] hydrogenase, group A [Acholeplasmatales bacterium]|nr:[FeFe] hydrogenase, group A [Acholeplasmatales bacterium]
MSKFDGVMHRVPINENNPSIICNDSLCKKCQLCKKACSGVAGVLGTYNLEENGDNAVCINCGACITACPFNALSEVYNIAGVLQAIHDDSKKVIFLTAPAVRVSLGDAFGMESGTNVQGKMVTALRMLGADVVLDVTFGADLTIMEEASELVYRIQNNGVLPMFTSCCPGWVKYCEIYFPELIPNLSSCKSPIAMQATMVKTYYAKKMGLDPKDLVVVSVAPCTAKKAECKRPELSAGMKSLGLEGQDCDMSITTRELSVMIKEAGIDFANLKDSPYDPFMGTGTGSGMIFGNTGGVMEAALRTAFFLIEGRNMNDDELPKFEAVRGFDHVKEAEVTLGGKTIRVAVMHQMSEAAKGIKELMAGDKHYDFVEIMACKGGCAGGGGQIKIIKKPLQEAARVNRNTTIYDMDKKANIRFCHDNPEIKAIYKDFLEAPLSHISHELLHTTFEDKSWELTGKK